MTDYPLHKDRKLDASLEQLVAPVTSNDDAITDKPARLFGVYISLLVASCSFFIVWIVTYGITDRKAAASSIEFQSITPKPALLASRTDSSISLTGYYTAEKIADVSTTVVGRVEDILISKGEEVGKGQILAHLEPHRGGLSSQIEKRNIVTAELEVAQAKIELEERLSDQANMEMLYESNSISKDQVDKIRRKVERAKLALSQAENTVQLNRLTYLASKAVDEEYVIRAPFDGTVLSINAHVGEIVSPSSYGGYIKSGIVTIADKRSIVAAVDVQEKILDQIRRSQCAVSDSDELQYFSLDSVELIGDQQTNSIQVLMKPLSTPVEMPILNSSLKLEFIDQDAGECQILGLD